MDNTNQRKFVLQGDLALFLRGLIIGKVLTILVIGGMLWWFLRPSVSNRQQVVSSPGQNTAVFGDGSSFKTLPNVPVGTFNYGGSPTWAPIRQFVDSYIQSDRPELQLRYIDPAKDAPDSSTGIRMLLDGQLDFAQVSRPLKDEEYALAKQQGFALEQRQIGKDAIAVVVNPSLQVSGLTVEQLQQIYLGQITNWKQVGGPDLLITPLSLNSEDAAIAISSNDKVLNKQTLASNVKYVSSTTEALRQVNQTLGGIYYASARAVVPQCSVKALPLGMNTNQLVAPYSGSLVSPEQCPRQRNQVNTEAIKNGSYPITTDLFVVIKQNSQQQQAGEAYANLLLSDQGQQAIEQAGFARIR